LEALDRRFKEEVAKIKDQQVQLEKLRADLNIPDMMAAGEAPTMLMTAETLRKFETLRIESQNEYVRQETLLTKLKELSPDQLAQALPTAAQDSLLGSLLEQQGLRSGARRSLKGGRSGEGSSGEDKAARGWNSSGA
jgi:hypothetical protein